MITVAADDIIAVDLLAGCFFFVGDIWSARRELVQLNIAGLLNDLSADRITSRIEVFSDRVLAVGHHGLASEFLGVDEEL